MLPRWHIFYGLVLSLVVYQIFPEVSLFNLTLVFLSAFLIDFDHYITSSFKLKTLSLSKIFQYHKEMGKLEAKQVKNGIKVKGDFHLFHTVEFHLIILALSLLNKHFFFIFIGMLFHSIIDVFSLISRKVFYRRQYFLTVWIYNKLNKTDQAFSK